VRCGAHAPPRELELHRAVAEQRDRLCLERRLQLEQQRLSAFLSSTGVASSAGRAAASAAARIPTAATASSSTRRRSVADWPRVARGRRATRRRRAARPVPQPLGATVDVAVAERSAAFRGGAASLAAAKTDDGFFAVCTGLW